MKKRIAAASLWLFAGWYLGTAVAVSIGFPAWAGLLLGIALAIVVASDPTGHVWTPPYGGDPTAGISHSSSSLNEEP